MFFLFFSNISENRRFHYNRCHFDSWACLSITNLPWIGFSWFSFSLVFVVLRIGKYINFLFSQSVQSETSSKFNTVVIFFISERWFKFFYPSRYKMAGKMALHKRFWIFSSIWKGLSSVFHFQVVIFPNRYITNCPYRYCPKPCSTRLRQPVKFSYAP